MEMNEYQKMYNLEKTHGWFVGRRELIINLMEKIIRNEDKQLKILDTGCGTGGNMEIFTLYGDVVGMDYSEDALKYTSLRGITNVVQGDAERPPFKNKTFDIVCILDVLEHLENDKKTVKEIRRILRNNGYLIITLPAFKFLWGEHDVVNRHKRRYEKKMLLNLLNPNNFSIEKISYWNFTLFLPTALSRLLRKTIKSKQKTKKSELYMLPNLMNKILLLILHVENHLIMKGFYFPFGISIICVAKKVD